MEEIEYARAQAAAQLASIVEMVKRLKHTSECTGDEECGITDEEICNGLNLHYEAGITAVTDGEREDTTMRMQWSTGRDGTPGSCIPQLMQ